MLVCDVWFAGSQHTVAFMATTARIYLLQQNFHQPEPIETGPLLQQFSHCQFATIASEDISDISELVCHDAVLFIDIIMFGVFSCWLYFL